MGEVSARPGWMAADNTTHATSTTRFLDIIGSLPFDERIVYAWIAT
jgi:hypothetical protein